MLEDFEISQVLGLTSFGVLYLATHAVEGHTVAIKEYLPSALATRNAEGQVELLDPSHEEAFDRGLQAFASEALTLSQFDQPNLLRVTCVWEGNGTAYRAMPHLVGSNLLTTRSSTKEPLTQSQLQALFDSLLGALGTLGDAGLSHGQVEPVNIFMPEGGVPVLMDFDAVHHAVLSDMREPHLDTYADPAKLQQTTVDDLHAVVAVLHYAISADWAAPVSGKNRRHEPLADVLTRLKDSASALGYHPDFLTAIDSTLALAPADRPRDITELRALFGIKPQPALAEEAVPSLAPTARAKAPRPSKRPAPPPPPQREYPLNSSESVLELLARFERPSRDSEIDIEPFENPPVPTLTEEAEPTLPPMRTSLFDAMDAGDSLPQAGVGYGRASYTPMPRIPVDRWRRRKLMLGVVAIVLACIGALGWQLFA